MTDNTEKAELKVPADAEADPAAPPAPPTPAEIEEWRREATKAREHREALLRTAADFENFKKRVMRERQDAQKYAFEPLLAKLIPVLDNFEMALAAVNSSAEKAAGSLQTGVAMIQQQFKSVLTDAGLEEIDATGRDFDPNCHEAVSQQETTDVPEGRVVQQLRKGYRFRDRLLRPASVVVARKPAT